MGRISDLIEKTITRESRVKYEAQFYAEAQSREGEQAIREHVRNRARVAVLVDAIVEVRKLGTVSVDRRDRIALSGCYERLAKLIQNDRTLMTQTGDLNRNEFQTLLRVINVVAKQAPPPVPAEPTLPQTAPPEPPEVPPPPAIPAQQSSPRSPQVSAADSPYGSLPSAAQLKAGLDASESPYSFIPSAPDKPISPTSSTIERNADAYGKFPAFDDKTPLTNVSQARRPTLTTVEQLSTAQPPHLPEKSDVQPVRERRVRFAEKPDALEFEKGSPPNQLRAASPEIEYRRNIVDVMDDSRAGHRNAREPSKNPFVKFFKNFLGKSSDAAAEKSQEAANKAESPEGPPVQPK